MSILFDSSPAANVTFDMIHEEVFESLRERERRGLMKWMESAELTPLIYSFRVSSDAHTHGKELFVCLKERQSGRCHFFALWDLVDITKYSD